MKTLCMVIFVVGWFWVGEAKASCAACICGGSSTGIAFGNYLPTASTNSTGTVTISCLITVGSGTVAYSIGLSTGNGTFAARSLTTIGGSLGYNIYTTSSNTSVLGDGTSGTTTLSDSYAISSLTNKNYTVYGKIPAGQNAAAGVYGDTMVVTISY